MFNQLLNLLNLERKRSAIAPVIAFHTQGQAQWTPRNYAAMAREGFQGNAIGYRCVRMIAEAAASIPLLVYEGDGDVAGHPLVSLLAKPNPGQGGREFLESVYGFLLISGNAYVEAAEVTGSPRELYALRPDRMKVVASSSGWPEAYEYSVHGTAIRLAAENLLHVKLFNPLDDHYGMSPLEAACRPLDTHNAASAWNKAMLDNAARPSGALIYTGGDGHLTAEQRQSVRDELDSRFQGAANAGRPLVLEGGLDWKEIGLSPKDMDFIEAKNQAARDVALAFGVPPMLLGIPGDNTFANYAEANRSFWRQTVLPHAGRVIEAMSGWLGPRFGGVRIEPDLDRVEALSADREALWSRLEKASFLSEDEKRIAAGYPARGS
ncbi:MAG: phage portal protein [Aestuariivirga sp.]